MLREVCGGVWEVCGGEWEVCGGEWEEEVTQNCIMRSLMISTSS